MHCDHCHEPIPGDVRSDARFCRPAHRTAWHNARSIAARDLVMRQTLAITAGASAAELDALLAEAVALFGGNR